MLTTSIKSKKLQTIENIITKKTRKSSKLANLKEKKKPFNSNEHEKWLNFVSWGVK